MSVHFEESGNPNDETIVLVHGAGGSSATWIMQLRGLSTKMHVVSLDLNGHGETLLRREKEVFDSYLHDIESVVKMFSKAILAGHSMGGALTQMFALQHPEMLRGIVLVGTGSKLRVNPAIFEMLENDFERYVQAVAQFMFDKSTSQEIVTASQAEVRKCPVEVVARDFAVCDSFNLMDRVNKIEIPTLIIVGESDQMTPVKYSQYMHQLIQDSKLVVLPQAGHAVMLEQAERFNKTVLGWVSSLERLRVP
jgi:pimeloyl-ACP methyl ester carboxylesterase